MIIHGTKNLTPLYVGNHRIKRGYLGDQLVYRTYVSGIDWHQGGDTPTVQTSWKRVAYGKGVFVAVTTSNTNLAIYSTDGIHWETSTLPYVKTWQSVTFGNGVFVAIAQASTSEANSSGYGWSKYGAYSYDGINWNAMTLPYAAYWNDVIYGTDRFIAVPRGNNDASFASSTDGINWKSIKAPSTGLWNRIRYGNGMFLVTSGFSPYSGSGKTAYSTDGVTWTQGRIMNTTSIFGALAYGNGMFIANNTIKMYYSYDGVAWNLSSTPKVSAHDIVYADGKFVGVGTATASGYYKTYYSENGIDWIGGDILPGFKGSYGIAYGDKKFVTIEYGGNTSAYSFTGGSSVKAA